MALISLPKALTDGTVAYGADVKADLDTIANDYNGNITNANIAASAAIVDTKLAQITTTGKVSGTAITGLASLPAGAGVIPIANIPSASSTPHYIKGAKLIYDGVATYHANAGEIEIGGSLYTRTTVSTTMNMTTAGHFLHGSEGASTWYYVYAYNDAGTTWDLKMSDEAPNISDVSDNSAGILRYRKYSATYYRCIGAVRNNASSNIAKFTQVGNWSYYDIPVQVLSAADLSAGAWATKDCSIAIPRISQLAFFNIYFNDTGTTAQFFMRPTGATWGVNPQDGAVNYRDTATTTLLMQTDALNQIDHYEGAGDDGSPIGSVFGYNIEELR